jgi:hypothetical protein
MSKTAPVLRQCLCARDVALPLVLFTVGMPSALADTRLERHIAQEPPPHQSLAQSKPQERVHWARWMEQLGDDTLNQQRLDQMRDNVQDCIRSNQERGQPVKRIEEWPSRQYRNRRDSYVGQQASITYSHTSTYQVNVVDCSLMEGESHGAKLTWSGGLCDVDLKSKTTSGNCPKGLHALSQPAVGQRSAQGIPRIPPGSGPNPLLPRPTGEVRTVASQTCDVVTNPLDPDGGTVCFARAVGFAGHGLAPVPKGTALSIESRSKRGFVYEADIVQMNFAVPQDIFVPHLQGGFSARPLQGDRR